MFRYDHGNFWCLIINFVKLVKNFAKQGFVRNKSSKNKLSTAGFARRGSERENRHHFFKAYDKTDNTKICLQN